MRICFSLVVGVLQEAGDPLTEVRGHLIDAQKTS